MTNQEFSDIFDTLLNSYSTSAPLGEQHSRGEIVLDEYEKSVLLTQAQEEVIVALYNGKNPYRDSFESTEEIRRYLESLVKTRVYSSAEQTAGSGVSDKSVFYQLPDDIIFITMEQATYDDESLGCYNGNTVTVCPTTQDEYGKVKNNPFRGPTKYRVLRLDSGNNVVELISNYKIGEYLLKYLSNPTPIILETLPKGLTIKGLHEKTECVLHPILHNTILERAVQIALQVRGIGVTR